MNRYELFHRYMAQTSCFPMGLEADRAEGMYVYDGRGKAYLDLISGIAVSSLGHRHPAVMAAIQAQLDRYMHLMVFGEFVQSPQTDLAAILCSYLPPSLDNVYFVNSGSEAIEGAVKLAKRFTGRRKILAFSDAYHGSSHGALSLTGNERLKSAFRPLLPGIIHLPYNSLPELEQIDESIACVVVEPIQGEAGARVAEPEFLRRLRQKCDETGALLIMDEIQSGLGRTGRLWAFEHYGVLPDILCIAKAFGGGLPLGAFVSGRHIMRKLTQHPVLGHITTFGGNPVCAAAALASFREITNASLWTRAAELEPLFRDLLKHPGIMEVRGKGLMLAVRFDGFETNKRVIDACLEKGIITDWFLFADDCLRIAPPLLITDEQVRFACGAILDAI